MILWFLGILFGFGVGWCLAHAIISSYDGLFYFHMRSDVPDVKERRKAARKVALFCALAGAAIAVIVSGVR